MHERAKPSLGGHEETDGAVDPLSIFFWERIRIRTISIRFCSSVRIHEQAKPSLGGHEETVGAGDPLLLFFWD